MQTRPSHFETYVRRILGCVSILAQIFILSGCATNGNFIPQGYNKILEEEIKFHLLRKLVRSEAARLDYPIPVAVNPDDQQIEIHWTKNGEIIWTKPFWNQITWWRLALLEQTTHDGKETSALCYTEWANAGSDDLTTVPCKFPVKNYIGKPLVGMLQFRLGGDAKKAPDDNEITQEVYRLYYPVLK